MILAISAFAALVSMGGAPKASILLGKGETEQAEKVVGSCTWMLLLLSVLLTGIMLAFGRPILLLFGASTDTISYAADYMNIYCLGTVFTQLTLGLNAFITAQGKTLVSMGNAAIGAAANIVLDAASMSILSSVMQFVMLLLPGLVQGAQPLLSYNLGAENIPRVKRTFRLLLICCVSGSFLIWLLCMSAPGAVAAIFTNDAALIAYTIRSMRIYLAALLIYGVQVACQYSFVALDQAPKAIFLTI